MQPFRSFAHQHLSEMVAELSDLCALPSVAGQSEVLHAAAEHVAQAMEAVGLKARILSAGGPPVVVAEHLVPGKPTVLFYDHYDVQPAGDERSWRFPPFSPRRYRRRLYARGAVDNKGDLVARLWAVRAWQELHGGLPVGVRFLVEGEEELGSPHLAAFVEKHGDLLQADGCIWEYGETDERGRPYLYLGMKGILGVELQSRGAAADLHSSWATIAPNPAWRLVWAISRLKSSSEEVLIDGFYDQVVSPSSTEVRRARRLPFPEEEIRNSWQVPAFLQDMTSGVLLLSLLYTPTCNICAIEGGSLGEGLRTVVPAEARAHLDFRLVPGQQPEEVLELLRKYLDDEGYGDITVRQVGPALPPFRTPPDHPFVRVVEAATRKIYRPRPAVFPIQGGSGPMHVLGEKLGLPIVTLGVGYPGSNVHSANENVRLVDLERGVAHAAAVLGELAEGLPK